MLRLVLLVLYLAALYSSGQSKAGGGLDPLGLTAQPQVDRSANLDPDGLTVQPQSDLHANLDPNG
jgi:hypothetical protein